MRLEWGRGCLTDLRPCQSHRPPPPLPRSSRGGCLDVDALAESHDGEKPTVALPKFGRFGTLDVCWSVANHRLATRGGCFHCIIF